MVELNEWGYKEQLKNALPEVSMERYRYFRRIAQNRFDWNIPDEHVNNKRNIEEMFYTAQWVCCWKDSPVGNVILPCTMSMNVNICNEEIPLKPDVPAGSPIQYRGDGSDLVAVPGDRIVNALAYYCEKINDIQIAKDQQIFNQRSPLMAIASDRIKMLKQNSQIALIGQDVKILAIESGIMDDIKPLNVGGQFNIQGLEDAQTAIETRILAILGIDSNFGKQERKVVDEQEANNGVLNATLQYYLDNRKKLADVAGFDVQPLEWITVGSWHDELGQSGEDGNEDKANP